MKCGTAQNWLFGERTEGSLPPAVREHLHQCAECRRTQQQLLRLDAEFRRLPPPPPDPATKARLKERLRQLPPRAPDAPRKGPPGAGSVPTAAVPKRLFAGRFALGRLAVAAGAAVLLLGLGIFLGRQTVSLQPQARRPEEEPASLTDNGHSGPPAAVARQAASSPSPGSRLLPRLVEHDVRLAASDDPQEQLITLTGMADDLGKESFRLARQGANEDLVLVSDLCNRVVRQGVIGRARLIPAEQRRTVLPPVVRQLQATRSEAEREAAAALPVVADLLRTIGAAAEEASVVLSGEAQAIGSTPAAVVSTGPQPLMVVVVLQGLRLAEETDPLRRADLCAQLGGQVAPMVVMVSARGDADEASALGASLGRLLHGAVAENLGRAESAGLDETGRAKADEIRRRADQASNVLQRNLSRAPPAARAGLQRAIEASQHGHQRAEQGGKGKGHKQGNTGPPWGREEGAVKHGHPGKGKGALPPGLQRKRAKDRAESTNSDQ